MSETDQTPDQIRAEEKRAAALARAAGEAPPEATGATGTARETPPKGRSRGRQDEA